MRGGGEGDSGGGSRFSFELSKWDGATKIEQIRIRERGDPNFGHFMIT